MSNFAVAYNLIICNGGSAPNYRRANASSVVDVTFVRPYLGHHSSVFDWTMLFNIYSASDYEYIEYSIDRTTRVPTPLTIRRRTKMDGWIVKQLSTIPLDKHLRVKSVILSRPVIAEDHTRHLQNFLVNACYAYVSRKT